MLLSMTGQGQGQASFEAAHVQSEIRTVNNRHLKIQSRCSEGLHSLEPRIEAQVKAKLRRGSVQLHVQLIGGDLSSGYRIEAPALQEYAKQCRELKEELGLELPTWGDLLNLPGVIAEQRRSSEVVPELEQAVIDSVNNALTELNRMRQAEGQSMAVELQRQLQQLAELTSSIETRAPEVVSEYRQRLKMKLETALAEVNGTISDSDVIREVLLLADKVDVREEIVRLRSHFEQFAGLLQDKESQGRKLDFLIQEMFRETNTIGSKASDAEITQRVVDMKSVIEQMRELVQNVE